MPLTSEILSIARPGVNFFCECARLRWLGPATSWRVEEVADSMGNDGRSGTTLAKVKRRLEEEVKVANDDRCLRTGLTVHSPVTMADLGSPNNKQWHSLCEIGANNTPSETLRPMSPHKYVREDTVPAKNRLINLPV